LQVRDSTLSPYRKSSYPRKRYPVRRGPSVNYRRLWNTGSPAFGGRRRFWDAPARSRLAAPCSRASIWP